MSQYKDIPQPQDQRNVSQNDILTNYRYLSTPINPSAGIPNGIIPVDHQASGDNVANPKDGFHNQASFINRSIPANLTNAINSQSSDSILYANADGAGNSQLRMLNTLMDQPISFLKCAVSFDATGAIIGNSFNAVGPVTKNGTGDFKVFFTTALSSSNYMVFALLGSNSNPPTPRIIQVFNKTAGGVRVLCSNTNTAALSDPTNGIDLMVIGFF
jgi:hypothetical protein